MANDIDWMEDPVESRSQVEELGLTGVVSFYRREMGGGANHDPAIDSWAALVQVGVKSNSD